MNEDIIERLRAELAVLTALANERGDRLRHLEDVSCRQQNEIERLRGELDASQAALSENLEIRAALERVTGNR
jgi:hypothetical protein